MNDEQRQEAIFGAFDGLVSIIGFVFGMLLHHNSRSIIAIGGLGGAISAAVSMGVGEIEKSDTAFRERLPVGIAMFVSTLVGSMVPVWPFMIWSKPTAIVVSGISCLVVATWIGYEKRKGYRGYVQAYMTFILASCATLSIISAIPASV